MKKDKVIVYSDLEELRADAKNLVDNAKRKSESDICKELTEKGYTVSKDTMPDELLKQADELRNKADAVTKEAVKKINNIPASSPVSFTDLLKYTKKIDENSDILKKVKENESLIRGRR